MEVNLDVLLDFYNNHLDRDEYIRKFKTFDQKTLQQFRLYLIYRKTGFIKLCWLVQKFLKFYDDNIIESEKLQDDIRVKMKGFAQNSVRTFETTQYHPESSQSSYAPTQCQCHLCNVDTCPLKTKIAALELKVEQQEQQLLGKDERIVELENSTKIDNGLYLVTMFALFCLTKNISVRVAAQCWTFFRNMVPCLQALPTRKKSWFQKQIYTVPGICQLQVARFINEASYVFLA